MSRINRVMVNQKEGQSMEDAALAAATLPGTLVQITGSQAKGYTATANAIRGQRCFIVVEQDLFGRSQGGTVYNVTTAIPIGERATCVQLETGMKVTAIVLAGVAINEGDLLVPDVNGLVDKIDATEQVTLAQAFRAEEACAAAASGDDRRIVLRVL